MTQIEHSPPVPNTPTPEQQAEVSRLTREGVQNPLRDVPPIARKAFEFLALPIELQQAYYTSVNGVLRNASISYRIDRGLQRMMRFDPALMAPLASIQMAFALASWKIEPVDRRDHVQVAQAKYLTSVVNDIPSLTDYRIWMSEGIWYGRSACLNRFDTNPFGGVSIAAWYPIDPDTIVSNYQGRLGFKVGTRYNGQASLTTVGPDSRVHMLDEQERQCLAFCRFRPTGPDFWSSNDTEYAHLGLGLRDRCWFIWKLKQHALQCWGNYVQRYGTGMRKAFHQDGNADAKAAMEYAAANMIGDVTLSIPDDGQSPRRKNDIEVHEPSAATGDTFYSLVVRLESKLKEMIEGQSASSEATSTGLGSSVGTEHARTKSDHVDYLAVVVDEAFRRDVLGPLARMNFGDDAVVPIMRTMVRKPEPEKYAAAVKTIVEMGGRVAQSDVYEYMGIREPDPGEPLFEKQEPPLIDYHGVSV